MEPKEFTITTIGGLADVSDLLATEDTLNHNIQLSDFGMGLRHISFTALIDSEPPTFHEPFWSYDSAADALEGSLPLDYHQASASTGKEAQRLICRAMFDLFDKVADQLSDFHFEALKQKMLQAVEAHPVLPENTRLRVYSDTGIPTGDFPGFSSAIDLSKYGSGVQKVFLEVSFFKNPGAFLASPPKFDEVKRRLHLSVVASPDIRHFASALDQAFEKVEAQVKDFDFEGFKTDVVGLLGRIWELG